MAPADGVIPAGSEEPISGPRWSYSSTVGTHFGTSSSTTEPTPRPVAPKADFELPSEVEAPPAPPLSVPTLRSPDGHFILTANAVTVRGQTFALRELERAELTPVHWILWYLLGGLGLAAVMIAFLQNWLRTGPAMLGMALTALLLAYGRRGTNRLRLHLLGREPLHFALPGEPEPWLRLSRELNRRVQQAHDVAAAEAAALLAGFEEQSPEAELPFQLP